MPELLAFAAFALMAAATPGPNNVLLTALGVSVGIRRGIPALFGIAFGFATMIFLLTVGVGNLLREAPDWLTWTLRGVGLTFLGWLAWQVATAPVAETRTEGRETADIPQSGSFAGAALFQWVNPKAWVVCTSAIAAHVDPEGSALFQGGQLALVFIAAAVIGCFPWLAAGTLLRRYLWGRTARLFNYVMAGLLLVSLIPVIL